MNMVGGRVVCWVLCLFWALRKPVLWCFGCRVLPIESTYLGA